jgi:succinate dehydrogenase/fumarate reductase flavoprotein subunit
MASSYQYDVIVVGGGYTGQVGYIVLVTLPLCAFVFQKNFIKTAKPH